MAVILHHNVSISGGERIQPSGANFRAESHIRPSIRPIEGDFAQRYFLGLSLCFGSKPTSQNCLLPAHERPMRGRDLRRSEPRRGGCACLHVTLVELMRLRSHKSSRDVATYSSPARCRNSGQSRNAFCAGSLAAKLLGCRGRGGVRSRRWRVLNSESSALVSHNEGLGRRPLKLSSDGVRPASLAAPDNGILSPKDTRRQRDSKYQKKLVVAVDVDEVLGAFVATLNAFCEEEYRKCYSISQYHIYDFKSVWGCSQEEANHRVHAFFKSRHFNQGIPPIPGAMSSLLRLQLDCNLVVVTSRQHVIRQPTLEWIEAHFPKVFEEVHFGNHYALEGVARPKSEICKSLGVEVLIDDNPKYALECAQHGIEVLLFDWNDSYPWSKMPDGPVHPLITRVLDWEEVEQVLSSRILALEP